MGCRPRAATPCAITYHFPICKLSSNALPFSVLCSVQVEEKFQNLEPKVPKFRTGSKNVPKI